MADFINLAAAWKDFTKYVPEDVPESMLRLIHTGFYGGANALMIIQNNLLDKYDPALEPEALGILSNAVCDEILQFRDELPCST